MIIGHTFFSSTIIIIITELKKNDYDYDYNVID